MLEKELMIKLDTIINLLSNNSSWLQNLFSTIIGVILGTVLTLLNQRIGSLKCYIVSYNERFTKVNNHIQEETNKNNEPQSCEIKLIVDFHNTMQHTIGLRDFFIEINHNKNENVQYKLKDNDTRRTGSVGFYYDEFSILNIESNSVKRKDLILYLDKNEVKHLQRKGTIRFVYRNEKNKIVKIKINEIKESH